MIAGKQFFGPHPFTPGMGKWEVFAGLQGSSCCNPHFTPLSSLGPDCFTPSPGNSQARQAGRHFLKSPRGGTGRGGGEARGRGQDPAGGDGDGVGVGTSWKTRPRAAQQFAKSGLSARGSVCAQAALGRGDPGLLHGGRPVTCPAPHVGRPRGSSGCHCSGL